MIWIVVGVFALVLVLGAVLVGVLAGDDDASSAEDGRDSSDTPKTAMWDSSASQDEVAASISSDFCPGATIVPDSGLGYQMVTCQTAEPPKTVTFYVYPDAETFDVALSAGIPCTWPVVVNGPTWMAEAINASDVVSLIKAGGAQNICE